MAAQTPTEEDRPTNLTASDIAFEEFFESIADQPNIVSALKTAVEGSGLTSDIVINALHDRHE